MATQCETVQLAKKGEKPLSLSFIAISEEREIDRTSQIRMTLLSTRVFLNTFSYPMLNSTGANRSFRPY